MRKGKVDNPKLAVLRAVPAEEREGPWDHIHEEPIPDALVQLARELQEKIDSKEPAEHRTADRNHGGKPGRKE
jgi:hypothetical protein